MSSFWYTSGTPTFLMDLIRDNHAELNRAEIYPLDIIDLEAIDVANLQLTPLLFQTGYLTVDKWIDANNCWLRGPNQEVSEALNAGVIEALTGRDKRNITALGQDIHRALNEIDLDLLSDSFMVVLEWIPFEIHVSLENYYHSVILATLKALSYKVRSEESTSEGRLDLMLELSSEKLYIFEFKFKDPSKPTPAPKANENIKTRTATGSKAKTKTKIFVLQFGRNFVSRVRYR
jgi:hypothetical protein